MKEELSKFEELTKLEESVKDGCILYLKDGKIEMAKAPEFGELTFYYSNGVFNYMKRVETTK